MQWVRIDNRLIHGQVIETWVPFTNANSIFVASDEMADDVLQQEIMSLAIPHSMSVRFVRVDDVAASVRGEGGANSANRIVLFSNCADARRAFEHGLSYDVLNIGNVHYQPGRRQLSPSVALSPDDEACLRYLVKQGVELDFRCVPNDPVQVRF